MRVYEAQIHIYITGYKTVEDSAISCDFVRSASECESAAHELGLSDVTVFDDGQNGAFHDPPFCYFEGEILKFNDLGTNTGHCTTYDVCLCRENDFCAKTPCGVGQGDCDDDTECEGSLVCGHLICMDSTITDCCTQSCNTDSDCVHQECNTEINGCRQDSYSPNWLRCSQDSPCNDGEGDCDNDGECEGLLVCGNDNCLGGPSTMDCCIGKLFCPVAKPSSFKKEFCFLRSQMLQLK